jgi:toxic protein SymE
MTSTRTSKASPKTVSDNQSKAISLKNRRAVQRDHANLIVAPTATTEPDRLNVSFYQEENREVLWIRLCGKGIKQTGFSPHFPVRVRVMGGCLMITSN